MQALVPSPAVPPVASPAPFAPVPSPTPAVVQVKCPSCGSLTMATPGQPSVCFSCGQPLPASVVGTPPQFPLTGPLAQIPAGPPPNPYGQVRGVRLVGAHGEFPIAPGGEVRAGRDPARCAIAFTEPRVSGLHATLKLEGGQLWVRDETSNNGTYVSGARIPAGTWTPVPIGAPLRFGPIELVVRGD